ncbi:MAG: hypothetical protein NTV34_18180, partial [Proteobacteria bacterium]|nr:hypothetical protein [Pseudomonadota bacterium]
MDHPFSNLKRDAECEGDSDAENANLTPREFAAVLHPYLSKDFWRRSPLRAGYIPLAYAILYLHFHVTKLWLIEAASPAMWISSLFVCANMGTAWFFIMHEILHGAIFKSKSGSWLFAFLGGVPFLTTPHVWKRW